LCPLWLVANDVRQAHQVQFPTLARMARDYLAIPGSSVASECVFLSIHHIRTDFHNCLLPPVFEAIQILKAAYKVGTILAAGEVEVLAKLDDNDGEADLVAV
jgi:hypothetical protein